MVVRRTIPLLITLCLLAAPALAAANTSHAGWPKITGVLLMNKRDQSRPLDARPGQDPFDNSDPSYSCDGVHGSSSCIVFVPSTSSCLPGVPLPDLPEGLGTRCAAGRPVARLARLGHNELLGGHGNNTIYAGPAGDVVWGDYKPSGDPTTQVNHLYGGAGNDFIYAAHGTNYISTGGGTDVVHAHFGGGEIHCDSPTVTVYLSRMSRPHYKLFGCRHISYKTDGY
jgi:hypothetical protein